MSYQVLARKWRPKSFLEMVGQLPILRMLTNALDNQRLHHAYLFTGTRGVGKTTLGRILAKCLNCEKGITSTPCGTCNTCTAIDSGRFLDLIEVDAASRTKVEDTRELLENVQYPPTQGRFKVYLIDEAHMLSGHSFNALLKTLEEPPEYVKFILATTDPKKLPVTILSRCLQFNLKRVPLDKIAEHLEHICKTENISYEIPALQLLAKAADGSMRDALSLLDQTIAFCGQKITTIDTQQMLGSIDQEYVVRLLQALAESNGKKLLAEVAQLAEMAPDFGQVLDELLSLLHHISVAQLVPETATSDTALIQLAQQLSAEEVQLFYQIALLGRRDLSLAPYAQYGLEMVLLRMLAFRPALVTPDQVTPAPPTITVKPEKTSPPTVQAVTPPTKNVDDWTTLLSHLGLTGMAQALAANCTLETKTEDNIVLTLARTHEPMLNKKLADRIEQALNQYLNKPIKLTINITAGEIHTPAKQQQQEQTARHASAAHAIQNDQEVKKMLDLFGAAIDMDSIKPV